MPTILLELKVEDAADLVKCSDCASMTDTAEEVDRGGMVCETCRDQRYVSCEDCEAFVLDNDATPVLGGDTYACRTCLRRSYSICDGCQLWQPDDDMAEILDGSNYCDGCRGERCNYCEDCDGYYLVDIGCGGDHTDRSVCEAPYQAFTMRNDGEPALANDVRVTITLPAGVISDEGLAAIRRYIQDSVSWEYPSEFWNWTPAVQEEFPPYRAYRNMVRVSDIVYSDELGNQWQTRQGNFTKRLSRLAYQRFGTKLSPEVLSNIGCIARDNATAVDHRIEVTRNLNMSAADFGHEGSCWWQSYSEGRCALKTNGGLGMRSFDQYGHVTGRAWLMPLRKVEVEAPRPFPILQQGEGVPCRDFCGLSACTSTAYPYSTYAEVEGPMPLVLTFEPTHDTETPDAWVVFNGYGDLGGYTATRILSHMAGMTYRKIQFRCEPMYVNNDWGYLVAPEDIAQRYTDGSLRLSVEQHAGGEKC